MVTISDGGLNCDYLSGGISESSWKEIALHFSENFIIPFYVVRHKILETTNLSYLSILQFNSIAQ